jgi:S-adenosylmethionine-diacylglycerol 3-amino-3-carboxypropyl transferase
VLKFAVVREDPRLEVALVEAAGAARCLTVASGGCTALTLAHRFPTLEVHAFDVNADQLTHVRAKQAAVAAKALRALNVGEASAEGLSQRGEFERLFRVLRAAVLELVCPAAELEAFFIEGVASRRERLRRWQASPYWPAVFEVAFAEGLLHAMFGPDATRHAERHSYPRYFQRAFERGLHAEDAGQSPFLQHVFLQRYLEGPAFLHAARRLEATLHHGTLTDVPDLGRFGVVSLSNVFDWSEEALVVAWARALQGLAPGSLVVWRQLNNQRDWRAHFEGFEEDAGASRRWTTDERAQFYERVTVMRRR